MHAWLVPQALEEHHGTCHCRHAGGVTHGLHTGFLVSLVVVAVVVDVVSERFAVLTDTADAAADRGLASVVFAQFLWIRQHSLEELERNDFHAIVHHRVDASHADVLNHAQVGEIFFTESHPEAGALDGWEVEHERFEFFVIHQVAFARTDFGVSERLVHFERTGLNPLAVFVVAALLGDFANVDFWVEVGGKRLAVVTRVAVHNVEGVHFLEVVLSCVGSVDATHAWVETAAEDGAEASLFEALTVSPLPAVLKVSLVAWLIVGGVEVVHATFQASVHNGEVLVRESQVHHQLRLVLLQQSHQLLHIVGIHLVGSDVRRADGLSHLVAFLFTA